MRSTLRLFSLSALCVLFWTPACGDDAVESGSLPSSTSSTSTSSQSSSSSTTSTSETSGGETNTTGSGTTGSLEGIGPEGGLLEGPGGVVLVIPEGALDTRVHLQARLDSSGSDPTGFTRVSDRIRFEPEGTEFARPVEVRWPYDGEETPAIVWSTPAGGFEALETTYADGELRAYTVHFSTAFLGLTSTNSPPFVSTFDTPSLRAPRVGESVPVSCQVSDPDPDDVVTLTWTTDNGVVLGTGPLSAVWEPSVESVSSTIECIAEDQAGDRASLSWSTPVVGPNVPPTITSFTSDSDVININNNQSSTDLHCFAEDANSGDLRGDTLHVEYVAVTPGGVVTTYGNGRVSFHVEEDVSPGIFDVECRVTDSAGNIARETLQIRVNSPPEVALGLSHTETVAGGQIWVISCGGQDAEDGFVQGSVDSGDFGQISLVEGFGAVWTATPGTAGAAGIHCSVTDSDGGFASTWTMVSVLGHNTNAPTIDRFDVSTPARVGDVLPVVCDVSDVDGDPVNVRTVLSPDGTTRLVEGGGLQWVPERAGTHAFWCFAWDSFGASVLESTTITVDP